MCGKKNLQIIKLKKIKQIAYTARMTGNKMKTERFFVGLLSNSKYHFWLGNMCTEEGVEIVR